MAGGDSPRREPPSQRVSSLGEQLKLLTDYL